MEEFIRKYIYEIKLFIKRNINFENDELPYIITILIAAVFFITGLNLFLEIAEQLAEDDLHGFDLFISNLIIAFRNEALTNILVFITHLGDRFAYITLTIIIAIILLIKSKKWNFILQIIAVNIIAFFINIFLKGYYGRERPSAEHLVEVSYLSFPSGHAMSAAAFYGFLIYLCLRYVKSLWLKLLISLICFLLILSIGLSRIYLGVHYPSDVLAGFLGGFFWVAFCIIIFNILGLLRKRKNEKA